ncbi:restriction endonuclease subunit S [Ancrocorticia populi]|uniref:Restriction endonuclease subunit S n=1 Tax=Ancrocorticia populi TaxID=2175228 RepID=A0A2V1K2N0_9ACTO|nr:restriction endonuclease subunit S [Ancrocorticia populi]PWF24478.1 restriction endonuclease subunit S [Ancrocorticia populi]
MSEWREVVLGDLCERVTVGHVGPMATQYVDSGVPFLRSQNVRPFVIDTEGMFFIGDEFNAKLRKSSLSVGDVVVIRTGYPGTASVIPMELDGANCADLVIITPSKELNPHLLAALFNSAYGSNVVKSQLVGSAQQHFNVGSAKRMKIKLPDRRSQDKIADVLCSFNDLIENNRRRVAVLEEMARTIYREWFVKFRYPGHEDVSLVDSELGPIPEGWKVQRLEELGKLVGGNTTTKAAYVATGNVAFSAAGPDGFLPDYEVDGVGVVLSAVGARCGRTFWASGRWSSIANTIKILPYEPQQNASWLYLATKNPDIWPKRGSAQPFVSINDARGVQIVTADKQTHLAFETCVRPLFDDVDILRQQRDRLASIRDLLLPKLVTGKIDVSTLDLDALVKERGMA